MSEPTSPLPEGTPSAASLADASDPLALRNVLGRYATGVTVVTALGETGPVGITANSFASLSLDPPLVLWSPALASRRYPVFAAARHFSIHVLAADQRDLCAHFTRNATGFESFGASPAPEGQPALPGVLARFDCVQEAVHPGGDHAIIVGRVLRCLLREEGTPLLFWHGHFGDFLHSE